MQVRAFERFIPLTTSNHVFWVSIKCFGWEIKRINYTLLSGGLKGAYQYMITIKRVFVWFDSLRPSRWFFSYVVTGLPGLNQY